MQQKEYKEDADKKQFELDKELKEVQKVRMDIEADLRKIERELDEALKDNYNHYLFQEGDKKTEEELKQRHDLEVKLLTELKGKKDEEYKEIKAKDDKLADDFARWKELQDNYKEQRDLKEGTQKAKIKI